MPQANLSCDKYCIQCYSSSSLPVPDLVSVSPPLHCLCTARLYWPLALELRAAGRAPRPTLRRGLQFLRRCLVLPMLMLSLSCAMAGWPFSSENARQMLCRPSQVENDSIRIGRSMHAHADAASAQTPLLQRATELHPPILKPRRNAAPAPLSSSVACFNMDPINYEATHDLGAMFKLCSGLPA